MSFIAPSKAKVERQCCLVMSRATVFPAALLSATARAYLRGSLLQGAGLDSAITMANTRIKEDTAEARFIVFIGAIFDANQHRLDVTAAGHPGFLLRSSSASFETINAKGIPLGIELESVFETTVFDSIADGDLLMLASDGSMGNTEFGRGGIRH